MRHVSDAFQAEAEDAGMIQVVMETEFCISLKNSLESSELDLSRYGVLLGACKVHDVPGVC